MSRNDWIAPEDIKIPDFIICGAMKSGTSTLHYILNEHPNIHCLFSNAKISPFIL